MKTTKREHEVTTPRVEPVRQPKKIETPAPERIAVPNWPSPVTVPVTPEPEKAKG